MRNQWSAISSRGSGWVANTPAALDALADGWTELNSHLCSPVQSLAWVRAASDTLLAGTGAQLSVVGVGPVDRPLALAPLSFHAGRPGWLELLSVQQTYEPGDFLYRSPEALDALVEHLGELGSPLLFRRLYADAPLTSALLRRFRRRGLVHAQPAGACPFIELDESWREPERHFPRKRRTDFRRSRRLAEEAGPVTYEILSPTPDALDMPLADALAVENASWKGRNGSSLLQSPHRRLFFERWARASAAEGALRLSFIRIGGKPAAMELGEERGGRYWTLKIGYDEAFSACSPGTLLALHVMGWAAAKGLRSYELMGFSADWTRRWTERERACLSVRIYPVGVRGLAALGRDVAESALRRVTTRLSS